MDHDIIGALHHQMEVMMMISQQQREILEICHRIEGGLILTEHHAPSNDPDKTQEHFGQELAWLTGDMELADPPIVQTAERIHIGTIEGTPIDIQRDFDGSCWLHNGASKIAISGETYIKLRNWALG